MFPIQIITDKRRIETTAEKIFRVAVPNQDQTCPDGSPTLKERTYTLQCGQAVYEIVCLEIPSGESSALIIPEFLIPGRPYPIYVYIYGMVLYSSNPTMGQREAAEKTRKRFGLEKFCHTTLGRAMKTLEALINSSGKKPDQDNEVKEPPRPVGSNASGAPMQPGRFPSVELTAERRDTVLSYLKEASGNDNQLTREPSHTQPTLNFKRPPYRGAFIDTCHRIVDYTIRKFYKLLL